MARLIPRTPIPLPRAFFGYLSFDFKIVANAAMPHGGASLRVQMRHGGASERVQMTNLRNKEAIIASAHKYMYIFLNIVSVISCNSSNCILTAKPATISRTVHVLLSVISRSQVETIVQIFAHVRMELYANFKVRKTELFLTMSHPWADPIGKCPTVGKGK